MRERTFTREKTLTGVVGQDPAGHVDPNGGSDLCKWVECLADGKVLQPSALDQLKALGIDGRALLKCLRRQCRKTVAKG